MAAVDKAAKDLPATEDLKMTVFEGDGAFGNRPADDPPNAGSKVRLHFRSRFCRFYRAQCDVFDKHRHRAQLQL